MKLKSVVIAAMVALATLAAEAATVTPSNRYVTRKVTSGAFDAVRTNTSIDIIYTVGPRNIEIYAPDNLIQYVQVALKGSELIVSYKEDMTIKGSHKTHVKISAPDVVTFTAASAGEITIKSPISQKSKTVTFSVLSAGDIKSLDIEAMEVKLRTNSAGDIETGNLKANDVSIIANSAGDIETGIVTAKKTVKVIANSAGDIEVPEIVAGESLSASANSAGDIDIKTVSVPTASFSSSSAGELKVNSVKATDVSGSTNSAGDVTLAGICTNATFSTGSSGGVNARNLKANHVIASSRGVGDITCQALESLSATRTSMGEIRYAGNPTSVTIDDRRNGGVRPL